MAQDEHETAFEYLAAVMKGATPPASSRKSSGGGGGMSALMGGGSSPSHARNPLAEGGFQSYRGGERNLMANSTRGSKPFTKDELRQGYRRLKG